MTLLDDFLADPTSRFATVAMADTNGLLRGQMVSTSSLKGIAKNGMGMAPAQLSLELLGSLPHGRRRGRGPQQHHVVADRAHQRTRLGGGRHRPGHRQHPGGTTRAPPVHPDDDDGVRQSLSSLVRALGYEVRTYACAADFLADACDPPDCLLTDVQMPQMDGDQLQAELLALHDAIRETYFAPPPEASAPATQTQVQGV